MGGLLGPLWGSLKGSSGASLGASLKASLSFLESSSGAFLAQFGAIWGYLLPSVVSEFFLGTPGASCAEPSEARLRAADEPMISFIIVKACEGRTGEREVQSASLLPRCIKRCFVLIPLARFPFLLSQVFSETLKPLFV